MERSKIKIGGVYEWGNPPCNEPSDPEKRIVRVISDRGPGGNFQFTREGEPRRFDFEWNWLFEVEDVQPPSDPESPHLAARTGDLGPVPQSSIATQSDRPQGR